MLGNFMYCNPTRLYFGEDALVNLGGELAKHGKTVLLTYTRLKYQMVAGIYDIFNHICLHGLAKFRRFAVNVWEVYPQEIADEAVAQEGLARMEVWMNGYESP